jgi:hypothetical protein
MTRQLWQTHEARILAKQQNPNTPEICLKCTGVCSPIERAIYLAELLAAMNGE